MTRYDYMQNDPFDRSAPIRMVLPRQIGSREYMESIRAHRVPADSLAMWFLGQNGFVLRAGSGPLVAIDPYLTNSVATNHGSSWPFRLDRQLPVFVEPEDFDVDVLLLTHSHEDHADPETLARYGAKARTTFVAPWETQRVLEAAGVKRARVIHAKESMALEGITIRGAFALPTDSTDLNHVGFHLSFDNGLVFYNSGDSAYAGILPSLHAWLPPIDVASVCINGGFHNLAPEEAAEITRALSPRVVIPCHYDMMVNNVGHPDLFRGALARAKLDVPVEVLPYYQPFLYRRTHD